MKLPCQDKFDHLQDMIEASERCWDGTGLAVVTAALSGIGTTLACTAAVLSRSDAAGERCGFGIVATTTAYVFLKQGLTSCNEVDLRGAEVARELQACMAAHKDVLNEHLRQQGQ